MTSTMHPRVEYMARRVARHIEAGLTSAEAWNIAAAEADRAGLRA